MKNNTTKLCPRCGREDGLSRDRLRRHRCGITLDDSYTSEADDKLARIDRLHHDLLHPDHEQLVPWLRERRLLVATVRRFWAGYCSPQPYRVKRAELLGGIRAEDLATSGLARRMRRRPDLEQLPAWFVRLRLADCLALPQRDPHGRVRSWIGRRVHPDLRLDQVPGADWQEDEWWSSESEFPPEPDGGRYLYIPARRATTTTVEGVCKWQVEHETEGYPLFIGPRLVAGVTAGPLGVWICESTTDALVAEQAGASAVATTGCDGYERQVDELRAVLERVRPDVPLYVCFDTDPRTLDAKQTIKLGRGQRGVCRLVARLAQRDTRLARRLRVVVLDSKDDTKQDLGAVLAAVPAGSALSTVRSQREFMRNLRSVAVEGWRFALDQLPEELAPEDLPGALSDVGIIDLAAADSALWTGRILPELQQHWNVPTRGGLLAVLRDAVAKAAKRKRARRCGSKIDADGIERTDEDVVRASYANLEAILKKQRPNVRHNEMALSLEEGAVVIDDKWFGDLRVWLERGEYEVVFGLETIQQAVRHHALASPYHPVREFLEKLTWDGVDRLGEVAEAFGLRRSIERVMLRCWLISAVARVFEPGCQADAMLVLHGPQGVFKSTGLQALAGPEWFSCDGLDLGSKDAAMQIRGAWIYEWAEIDRRMYAKDAAQAKAFITVKTDKIRPPYGKAVVSFPRTCVFAGTTNQTEFLKDATGDRRYWVCSTSAVQVERIASLRTQLWAQVVTLYRAGERWWLDSQEEHERQGLVERFRQRDAWAEPIGVVLAGLDNDEILEDDLIRRALNIDRAGLKDHELGRLRRLAELCGWEWRRGRPERGVGEHRKTRNSGRAVAA